MYSRDEESDARQIMGYFDGPAFVRRGRAVEAVWEGIVGRCRRERDDWLRIPRIRLAKLHALAGGWPAVERLLADPDDVRRLEKLFLRWNPRLRVPVARTRSLRSLVAAVDQLGVAFERFNRRWARFLAEFDLSGVNDLRAGYNRHYVFEKECALRSPLLAREGFRPLPPATVDDLFELFPLLPVPRSADAGTTLRKPP
jgi:hypothetical protein